MYYKGEEEEEMAKEYRVEQGSENERMKECSKNMKIHYEENNTKCTK